MPFKSLGKNLCFQYSFLCQSKACTQIPHLLLLWHQTLFSLLGCRLVLNKTNVFTGEQRMLLYHIITSHFICRDLQLLQSVEEPIHFLLSKAVNIFLWMYSLLKRHTTPFRNTIHSFWRNNIWQVLEICADSRIFLSFVLFGSSVIIVSFSFFFSLNPDVLSGSLWQCLGSFCLRFVQRVKLLSERSGLLQEVCEVPVLQHSPSPRSPLRVWSAGVTGSFLARCRSRSRRGAPGAAAPSCPGPAPAAPCRAGPDGSAAAPGAQPRLPLLRLPLCTSHMPESRWESEAQRAPLCFGGFSIKLPLLANSASDLLLGKKNKYRNCFCSLQKN